MRYQELFEYEVLDEMPMPADWDQSVYTPQTSYAKRIKYAAERAAKLGKGSSRSAFLINIDGKESVLKVAHNDKGLAQNEVEAEILSDYYAQQLNIMIPLIDYDEEHEQPLWINTERAHKVSQAKLCKLMCCETLMQVVGFARQMIGQESRSALYLQNTERNIVAKYGEDGLEVFQDYANRLADLGSTYDVQLGDFNDSGNWGLYNGRPVVIDIGLNSTVASSHYGR